MKKYDIPEIEIMHFLTEIVVASSGEPHRDYINEVNQLDTFLSSGEQQKRMENFSALLTYNE